MSNCCTVWPSRADSNAADNFSGILYVLIDIESHLPSPLGHLVGAKILGQQSVVGAVEDKRLCQFLKLSYKFGAGLPWQLLGKVPPPLQVANAEVAATFNIGGPICASVCTVLKAV